MKNINKIFFCLITLMLCFALSACITARSDIQQKKYLLEIPLAKKTSTIKNKQRIFVNQITEVAPFDQLHFIYRTKNQYLTDYYSAFLTPPAHQAFLALLAYLKNTTKFEPITTTEGEQPDIELQTRLTELYADYRDRDHPKAVITMRFVVVKMSDNKRSVLFGKTLSTAVLLKAKTSDALIAGWNNGFQNILQQVAQLLTMAQSI